MRKINLDDVTEAGEFRRPGAGPYICKITAIENVPLDERTGKGDYLRIWYDIDDGEFKGYYTEMRENHPDWDWVGRYIRSYKPSALSMFKRFCSAVSKSNGGYVFDAGEVNAEEQTLVGKRIGLVFQEEEYPSNMGDIRTKLTVYREFPVDKLADQKTPEKKLIPKDTPTVNNASSLFVDAGIDDELPFK